MNSMRRSPQESDYCLVVTAPDISSFKATLSGSQNTDAEIPDW
jgi:hypothetical protein